MTPDQEMVIKIPLSTNKYASHALVEKADALLVSTYKWVACKITNTLYVLRKEKIGSRWKTIYMHRAILGLKKGEIADHINGNGLDNRRSNLRKCTKMGNNKNVKARWGKSKYKGVCWHKKTQKWQAGIKANYKYYYLGSYKSEIEAAKAHDRGATKHHKEFANLNFKNIEVRE